MSMAFSNNQSYQQSPPNIRNQSKGSQYGQILAQTTNHHKMNNLFGDKSKTSTLNVQMKGGSSANKMGQNQPGGLFIGGLNSNHSNL
jgi:hypothetical protein